MKNTYIEKNHFELYDAFVPVFRLLFIFILTGINLYYNGIVMFKKFDINIFLLVYLLYALILVLFKKIRKIMAFKYPYIMAIFEMLLITCAISISGGIKSSFYLLYIIVIVFFAIVYDLKYTLLIGTISAIYYTGVILYKGQYWVPDFYIKVFFLFAFSCFTGLITEKINRYNMEMAVHDKLTSLYNRQFFYGEFENILLQSEKKHISTSLVVMDVDNFKKINDRDGHLEGDRIIAEIGRIIRENIRDGDIAARYGGDEFVIVLPDTSKSGAMVLCKRLINYAHEHLLNNITISVGIATYPFDGSTSKELFHIADLAMYETKSSRKKSCNTAEY